MLARHYTTGGTRPPFFPLRWIRSIATVTASVQVQNANVVPPSPIATPILTLGFFFFTFQPKATGADHTVGGVSLWLARQHAGRKKKGTRAAALARKKEVGKPIIECTEKPRTMLLTGFWSHLVSRYAGVDLRSRTRGFFSFLFSIWEHSAVFFFFFFFSIKIDEKQNKKSGERERERETEGKRPGGGGDLNNRL